MAIEQFVDYFKQLESEGHNLQLIFLVRDPRGMFNSRLRIAKIQYHDTKKTDDLVRVLQLPSKIKRKIWRKSNFSFWYFWGTLISVEKVSKHCDSMIKNLDAVMENDFLQKRTIIVRYEDIAISPEKFTQALYDELEIGKVVLET